MVETLMEKSRARVSPAQGDVTASREHRQDACPALITWRPPAAPVFNALALDVHVWAAGLELPLAILSRFREILSPADLQRADRFHFEKHRTRFVAAHAILRKILAQYLENGTGGKSLEFKIGSHGKPALTGPAALCGLHFNLTHSEDLMLLAVTRAANVGVDVERIRPMNDATDLVERFFSTRESAAFRKVPAARQPEAFFNLWTRKEAWLKATGEGIGSLLNRVEVSFEPKTEARLLHLPREFHSPTLWTLRELCPAEGYAAAIAVEAPEVAVRCWKWEEFE